MGFFLFIAKRNIRLYNVVEVSRMNQKYYHTTALEDWVTKLYLKLNIHHPKQITEERIARYYSIFLHRKERDPFYEIIGRYRGITIDARQSKDIQREMFYHELCHILRHAGVQSMMPEAFRELQEWDSQRFTSYIAIPHHMIKYIPFEDPGVIEETARIFKVTTALSEKRINQICSRIKYSENTSPLYLV
jgi:Zn-dependent peptidase ImmA (M78 family)